MTKARPLIALMALILAVGTLVASGETDEAKKSGDTSEKSSGPAEEFKVGDSVDLGDWGVKVHAFVDPVEVDSESFSPVDEGKRRVKVDAEVTNNGDEPASVSSLICFELKDGENKTYEQAFGDSEVGSIDGEIAPGDAIRGEVEYDVPAEATGFVLNFKCDLFSSGAAKITLT